MSVTYYNPDLDAFANPGQLRLKTGSLINAAKLKDLGYYEYYDPLHTDENIDFLTKDVVVIKGNLAVQTYRPNRTLLETLKITRDLFRSGLHHDAADDTAAATAGVEVGEMYHSSGDVKIRLT